MMNDPLSRRARKRQNRALLKAGALILPHEEAKIDPPRKLVTDDDRRIVDLHEIGAAHDRRCLDIIDNELPAIRAGYRRIFEEPNPSGEGKNHE